MLNNQRVCPCQSTNIKDRQRSTCFLVSRTFANCFLTMQIDAMCAFWGRGKMSLFQMIWTSKKHLCTRISAWRLLRYVQVLIGNVSSMPSASPNQFKLLMRIAWLGLMPRSEASVHNRFICATQKRTNVGAAADAWSETLKRRQRCATLRIPGHFLFRATPAIFEQWNRSLVLGRTKRNTEFTTTACQISIMCKYVQSLLPKRDIMRQLCLERDTQKLPS